MILDPTDQRIRDQGFNFVPFDRYLASPFQIPTIDPNTGSGITSVFRPRSVLNQGNQMSFTNQGVTGLVDDFTKTTRDKYFDRQDTPLVDDLYQSKLDRTFMGFPSFREQQLTGSDLGEYIGTGTDVPLELTRAGRIQQSLGKAKEGIQSVVDRVGGFGPLSFVAKSLDKFSSLPETDQAFINMNLGYTGPTVFGENTSGLSKDPYGINTRSMFGNYAEYVRDFDTDLTDEEYEKLSNYQKQKVDFYRSQQQKLAQIEQLQQAEAERQRADRERIQRSLDQGGYDSTSGRPDRDLDSVTEESAAASAGVGGGGYTASDSNRDAARGGQYGFMSGGLVDLVDIYD